MAEEIGVMDDVSMLVPTYSSPLLPDAVLSLKEVVKVLATGSQNFLHVHIEAIWMLDVAIPG